MFGEIQEIRSVRYHVGTTPHHHDLIFLLWEGKYD